MTMIVQNNVLDFTGVKEAELEQRTAAYQQKHVRLAKQRLGSSQNLSVKTLRVYLDQFPHRQAIFDQQIIQ
jgi:hypothetical protein